MFFHNHVSGNNFRTFLTGFNLLGDGGLFPTIPLTGLFIRLAINGPSLPPPPPPPPLLNWCQIGTL